MSRLIKKPIAITAGATLVQSGGILTIKGPKGELKIAVPHGVDVKDRRRELLDRYHAEVRIRPRSREPSGRSSKNAIEGVTVGFTKVLEIEGVGYRAVLEGKELVLFLGYALPVRMPISDKVAIAVEKNTIKVTGIDKDVVGQAAAEIRALKKPEPYKGKGHPLSGRGHPQKGWQESRRTAAA